MVLDIFVAGVQNLIPSRHWIRYAAGGVGLLVVHALFQGRKTTRERDLHGRVMIITGGFTPLGLTLVQALAERGAHVIVLGPEPVGSPRTSLIIDALRARTNNERLFAETCDTTSPRSIRTFCTTFLTGSETRIDALIFAHEYTHVGPVRISRSTPENSQHERKNRADASMATFLLVTLLLPVLLTSPTERDIRVLALVNPFYAAAIPTFDAAALPTPSETSDTSASTFLLEGRRALRTAVLMRHLQRVLDALPNRNQAPATDDKEAIPVVDLALQRSNIVSVAVSPGTSRADTVAPILGVGSSLLGSSSLFSTILYILLQPLIIMFIKSSRSAMQSVLHALFLPTPFKSLGTTVAAPATAPSSDLLDEVLKPGAFYAECAVVNVNINPPPIVDGSTEKGTVGKDGNQKSAGKSKARQDQVPDEVPIMPEDHDMGGVVVGTMVWEAYETALKEWEAAEPPLPPSEEPQVATGPEVEEANVKIAS